MKLIFSIADQASRCQGRLAVARVGQPLLGQVTYCYANCSPHLFLLRQSTYDTSELQRYVQFIFLFYFVCKLHFLFIPMFLLEETNKKHKGDFLENKGDFLENKGVFQGPGTDRKYDTSVSNYELGLGTNSSRISRFNCNCKNNWQVYENVPRKSFVIQLLNVFCVIQNRLYTLSSNSPEHTVERCVKMDLETFVQQGINIELETLVQRCVYRLL